MGSFFANFVVPIFQNHTKNSRCPKTCQKVLKIYNCVLLIFFWKTAKYYSLIQLHLEDMKLQSLECTLWKNTEFWVNSSQKNLKPNISWTIQNSEKSARDNFVEHIQGFQNHIWFVGIGVEVEVESKLWNFLPYIMATTVRLLNVFVLY